MSPAKKLSPKSLATRERLLAAARKQIGLYGYGGATVDSIAKEAGVSKGVVYYYFKTKAEIATNVLLDTFRELVESFQAIAAQNSNPHDTLVLLMHEFSHLIFSSREGARFILAEIWREERMWADEMRTLEEELANIIEGQLQKGVEAGAVRRELDLRFAAIAIVGCVLTSAQYYLLIEEGGEEESFTAHCIDFIEHALQA